MSGPIVRKYGFPNFEKIFGERPLEHGEEEKGPDSKESKKAESSGSQPAPADESAGRTSKPGREGK